MFKVFRPAVLADLSFISASELLKEQLLSFTDFAKMNLLISMRANDVEYTILQLKKDIFDFSSEQFSFILLQNQKIFFQEQHLHPLSFLNMLKEFTF